MGVRRTTTGALDRRAASLLSDPVASGSLRATDIGGAVEILSRALPQVKRMQRHAQELLAGRALLDAASAPPSPPRGVSRPRSGDLLPAVRTPRGGAARKRRRTREPAPPGGGFRVRRPVARLADVGGVDAVLAGVRELVEWPLRHMELYAHLGVDPPRGVLLHGPPGCGKTLLAHAIAGELDVPMLRVSAPEIVSGVSGDSERKVRELFEEARRIAPAIVFIDEVDTIASRREDASKDMGRRIVAQLLSCLDELGGEGEEGEEGEEEEDGGDADGAKEDGSDGAVPSDVLETDGVAIGADAAMVVDGGAGGAPAPAAEPRENVGARRARTGPVLVIAATNRPEVLEPALRRAGRFDREIELGAPDDDARRAILLKLCRAIRLSESCDFDLLAKKTAGYVGADLDLLVKEAGVRSIRRFATEKLLGGTTAVAGAEGVEGGGGAEGADAGGMTDVDGGGAGRKLLDQREPFRSSELAGFSITMEDFLGALEQVQPSALREGFATRPSVSWADVGALEQVRDELTMAVVQPIRVPERFAALGLSTPTGVLLYGPPGCGKTLLARAVASESGANFISVKGPELLSKYVGDSELAVRKLFHRARASAPCIVFFDELDALAPRRGGGGSATESSSGASERVVNMLLTEMDGFDVRKQVFLIAATNRPDIIDPAMLRPGRLEKLLYVPLPSQAGRVSILRTLLAGVSVAPDVDVRAIGADARCAGFSGADMNALIRAAGEHAMRISLALVAPDAPAPRAGPRECLRQRDFDAALAKVLPSVSARDARLYRSLETSLRKSRAQLAAGELALADDPSNDATGRATQ